MILSKTPFRISFFGGGSDFPSWYLKEGGAVLSTTIDKYCYISCRVLPPFFSEKHRIVWSRIELVSSIDAIVHPAVRGALKYLGFDDSIGLEIHHQGDLPARTGVGSSSAFTVGILNALSAMRGQTYDKHALALQAIHVEQNLLQESVGCQDQVAAAYGGFNVTRFQTGGEISVEPVSISPKRMQQLRSHLLFLYTGTHRDGPKLAAQLVGNMPKKSKEIREMVSMVDEATEILRSNASIVEFGKLLDEAWKIKKSLSQNISNQHIDSVYETAKAHGAIGGKILGAGGAGFMLIFAEPDRHSAIIKALPKCLSVPIQFENLGSHIIHYLTDASSSVHSTHHLQHQEARIKRAA